MHKNSWLIYCSCFSSLVQMYILFLLFCKCFGLDVVARGYLDSNGVSRVWTKCILLDGKSNPQPLEHIVMYNVMPSSSVCPYHFMFLAQWALVLIVCIHDNSWWKSQVHIISGITLHPLLFFLSRCKYCVYSSIETHGKTDKILKTVLSHTSRDLIRIVNNKLGIAPCLPRH